MTKNSKHDDFILRHYKRDMSVREISEVLKIPHSSVTSRYQILMGQRLSREGERIKYKEPGMPLIRMAELDLTKWEE